MHSNRPILNCVHKQGLAPAKCDWIKISFTKTNVEFCKEDDDMAVFSENNFMEFGCKHEIFLKMRRSASTGLISHWRWPVSAICQTHLNQTELRNIIDESNCH